VDLVELLVDRHISRDVEGCAKYIQEIVAWVKQKLQERTKNILGKNIFVGRKGFASSRRCLLF
jgi:hypothetical protein